MSKPAAVSDPRRGAPRRRVVPFWRTRLARGGALVVACGLMGAGLGYSWSEGWIAQGADRAKWAAIAFSARAGLHVRDVLVTGRHETSRDSLLAAIGAGRGDPILAVDPEVVRARVEALPWVRSAAIERRLPGTLVVRIEEREALAMWQNEGRFALIDRDGTVIDDPDIERFGALLVVVGRGAAKAADHLSRVLQTEPELMARVRAAVRVAERRWNLVLDNGAELRLPEHDEASALARIIAYQREHGVLDRAVRVLDLRQPDRVIVQVEPTPPPPVERTGGKRGRNT